MLYPERPSPVRTVALSEKLVTVRSLKLAQDAETRRTRLKRLAACRVRLARHRTALFVEGRVPVDSSLFLWILRLRAQPLSEVRAH